MARKCAQADCAGRVGGAVEEIGGGDGVAASLSEITRATLLVLGLARSSAWAAAL
jgi:hypothetical protein